MALGTRDTPDWHTYSTHLPSNVSQGLRTVLLYFELQLLLADNHISKVPDLWAFSNGDKTFKLGSLVDPRYG
jgi:hypothetical protein